MYVIMNVGTERLYDTNSYGSGKTYEEMRYAKSQVTRLNKQFGEGQHIIMDYNDWVEKYNPLVAVYNHITGDGKTPIMIRKSEVGGCCDPSTERYHCS